MQHVAGARTRDKVSNGTRLLPADVDMRTVRGRRLKHLVRSFREALCSGDISEIELSQLRQVASLTLRAESLSADIVRGEPPVSSDELTRVNSEIRRLLRGLGVKAPENKPAGPSLAEHLATKYGAVAAADEAEASEA